VHLIGVYKRQHQTLLPSLLLIGEINTWFSDITRFRRLWGSAGLYSWSRRGLSDEGSGGSSVKRPPKTGAFGPRQTLKK
jgi:hypothetical protein